MNSSLRRRLATRKHRIEQRLNKFNSEGCQQPMLWPANIQYELAERTQSMTYGGMGSMVLLVPQLGLVQAIDRRLQLLKIHLPYHESDHVLNFAYNALCDGTAWRTWNCGARMKAISTPWEPGGFRSHHGRRLCRRFQTAMCARWWTCSTKRG